MFRSNKHSIVDIDPAAVVPELKKHVLVDGFQLVVDLQRSQGSHFHDAGSNRTFVDLYGFYASMPIGFNHPHFDEPEVRDELLEAARTKVANSDVYTTHFARFVDSFERVAGAPELQRYFF